MFQLPPRTLANHIVLLSIKANKKDNTLECFTETALYFWNRKKPWIYKK